MTPESHLLRLVAQALPEWGGVVDGHPPRLHCLLPPPLAQQLGLDEDTTLSAPFVREGNPLIYGEPLLENFLDLLQAHGRISFIELTDLESRSGGLRGDLQQTVQMRNAIGDIKNIQPSSCQYLLLHYRFTSHCQQLSFGDFGCVAINEETLTDATWLHTRLTNQAYKEIPPLPWNLPFHALYPTLLEQLQSRIQDSLSPFLQSIHMRISQQRRQLERNHRRERKEILQPLLKQPSLDQAPFLAQLQDAEQQYLQQIHSISSQFPIHTHVEPFAILRLRIPITRVEYLIRKRKEERTIRWLWNPLLNAFEPLKCQSCQRETFQFSATDDLQLLCRVCADS